MCMGWMISDHYYHQIKAIRAGLQTETSQKGCLGKGRSLVVESANSSSCRLPMPGGREGE